MRTNFRLLSTWAVMACAAHAQAPAQPAGAAKAAAKPVFRDAATHDQLAMGYRKAQQEDPMRNLKKTEGEDPSVVNRPPGILASSDVISYNGLATLVPKRAVIQMPAAFSDRMKMTAGCRLVGWTEFFSANRGWINTVEVSRVQAEGNEVIAEETRKQMVKSGNLIVATYQGGPISVLPLKAPEAPAAGNPAAGAALPASSNSPVLKRP